MGSLRGIFLDIYLTTFFTLRKFKNTSAVRVIFLKKMFKIFLNLASNLNILKKMTLIVDVFSETIISETKNDF